MGEEESVNTAFQEHALHSIEGNQAAEPSVVRNDLFRGLSQRK